MNQAATWQEAVGEVSPAALLEALRERIHKSTITTSLQKGAYIAKSFPQMATGTIRMADEALEGMLVLPGTGTKLHFVGNPPLWNENPPNDNEYTFHLNRMHHWKTMCEAYSLTGDLRYAHKVVQELEDWITQNACPALYAADGTPNTEPFMTLNVWRALEVGIRGYRTWPLVLELLIDSDCITEQLLEKLLPCIHLHCRVLYEMSPVLWPAADHNHYLMENLGLLTLSCLLPELRDSSLYRQHAQHQLDRCMIAQCTVEGGQLEGCPSYHNGCVFWFGLRLVLADKYDLTVPRDYSNRLRDMFRYAVQATRACGGNFPLGDSHGADIETMSLAAVACYMAFGEKEFLAVARHFFPLEALLEDLRDNLWRLRRLPALQEDLQWADQNPTAPLFETFTWQKQLDQVSMRTGWERDALSVMTGCHTPVQNLHAHIDPGGFDFTAFGEPLVTDPGIYTYKDCRDRYLFKRTLSHNCLTINNKDAWEYIESWEYGPQRAGHITYASSTSGLQYAISLHRNYYPAVAQRLLALVNDRWLLVLDEVCDLPQDSLVGIHFNVNSTQLALQPDGAVATTRSQLPNVKLIGSGTSENVLVEAGRISPVCDITQPSWMVRFQSRVIQGGRYRHATLILPSAKGAPEPQAEPPKLREQNGALEILLSAEGAQTRLLLRGQQLEIIG